MPKCKTIPLTKLNLYEEISKKDVKIKKALFKNFTETLKKYALFIEKNNNINLDKKIDEFIKK